MCSVPPETGVAELDADVDDDDDELHAASPMAASTATASPAKRLGALIMGMFLLVVENANEHKPTRWRPALLIATYQERLGASGSEIQTKTTVVA
jgi:hypothetical protein